MAKINWQRNPTTSVINSSYYSNPKTGFDKAFWDKKTARDRKIDLIVKEHKQHNWQTIYGTFGPHKGKIVCETCNNKFLGWAPK